MTRLEKGAVEIYLKTTAPDVEEEVEKDGEGLGYSDRILYADNVAKKQRTDTSKYRSTVHVLPQSNLCERLFSHAKIIMSSRRKCMSPQTLNDLLFLKANRSYWPGTSIIDEIINASDDDSDSESEEDDDDI